MLMQNAGLVLVDLFVFQFCVILFFISLCALLFLGNGNTMNYDGNIFKIELICLRAMNLDLRASC